MKTVTRIVVGFIAAAGIVGAVTACDPVDKAAAGGTSITQAADQQTAVDTRTPAQRNAVAKAQDYLEYQSFSRSGLIKQLQFEGFGVDDATFAVDSLNVDWTEQAVKKAGEYMDYQSFSQQGLTDQLVFEGFTPEQAAAGAASQF